MISELLGYFIRDFIYNLPQTITAGIFLVLFLRKRTSRPAFSRPEVIACVLLLLESLVIRNLWSLYALTNDYGYYDLPWLGYAVFGILSNLIYLASLVLLIVAFGLLARKEEPASSQSAPETASDTFKA